MPSWDVSCDVPNFYLRILWFNIKILTYVANLNRLWRHLKMTSFFENIRNVTMRRYQLKTNILKNFGKH